VAGVGGTNYNFVSVSLPDLESIAVDPIAAFHEQSFVEFGDWVAQRCRAGED